MSPIAITYPMRTVRYILRGLEDPICSHKMSISPTLSKGFQIITMSADKLNLEYFRI